MKKYFYSDGTNNFGPFSIEELKEKEIGRETMIWFQELGDWQKAGSIQELNDLFALVPPPIQQQSNYIQQSVGQTNPNSVIDIFLFLAIAYWFATNLITFIIEKVVDDWWDNELVTYFRIGTNIIFAAVPIVFALSVKNKILKIIALILGALLSIYFLYSNIDWLIRELS
ncbi:DUF4339 domain-containing protein [Gaoshiqia sediminis]|uniref:DUF4339 domain-containing protein n=1 Tax=Gaoshiqia sediminis TaxID=2986998 RepID=A0AA41YDK1_9BACT|nr:DUF4339 domain-containing protein [Gaoshiqia sediminis]MCW0483447.1 DUF4339 domain-containing protein [Gaoshiqia sediminis]